MLLKVWRLAEITGVSRLRVEKELPVRRSKGLSLKPRKGMFLQGRVIKQCGL